MTGYDIYELIALPVFTLGVFWYYDRKFKKMKNALYRHSETLREDADEISLLVSTMVRRKMRYLRNCINAGRILPHSAKWITDEEERLYVKGSADRQKRIDDYKKILDIEIDENEN